MTVDNEIISFHSTRLLKNLFNIINVEREISIDDTLNISKHLWRNLIAMEMTSGQDPEVKYSQFKVFFMVEALNKTYASDQSNKTSNSTSELLMNSALGKTLISRLHRYENMSINYEVSGLLLKYLKASAEGNRLLADQNFFLNYSVILLKHYLLILQRSSHAQKKLSAEIIYLLVADNPIALNTITRLIPKHIFRKVSGSVNLRDITKWRGQQWYNAIELLSEEFDKFDTDAACVSINLLNKLRDYMHSIHKTWSRVDFGILDQVFTNVVHHQPSQLKDILKIVQIRHNFEEIEIDYSRLLYKVSVGKYFLNDLYDSGSHSPQLLIDFEEPEAFYNELKFFFINQTETKKKIETIKIMTLMYQKYEMKRIELMPYFIKEFAATDDLPMQYYWMQFFCAVLSCNEQYTRFHNMSEFHKRSIS